MSTTQKSLNHISIPHIAAYNKFIHSLPTLLTSTTLIRKYGSLKIKFNFIDIEFRNKSIGIDLLRKSKIEMSDYVCDVHAQVVINIYSSGNMDTPLKKYKESVYLGELPIMVGSDLCATSKLDIKKRNELNEIGGYFIMGGGEKVFRFLFARKSNVPLFLKLKEGGKYLYEINIRSCKNGIGERQSLLFNSNGMILFKMYIERIEYEIPLIYILKGLGLSDRNVYERICDDRAYNWMSVSEGIDYYKSLENRFEAVGGDLFERILPHLNTNNNSSTNSRDKADFFCFAVNELYKRIDSQIFDDIDSLENQEVLSEYELFSTLFYNRLHYTIQNMKFKQSETELVKLFKNTEQTNFTRSKLEYRNIFPRFNSFTVAFKSLIRTGRLTPLRYSSDIAHTTGLVVLMENLNIYRFVGYLMQVSRGTFFQTLSTSAMRKLRSESFGFICSVHTPDGLPCGILTHLANNSSICFNGSVNSYDFTYNSNYKELNNVEIHRTEKDVIKKLKELKEQVILFGDSRGMVELLFRLGMVRSQYSQTINKEYRTIILDGRVVGLADTRIINKLRKIRSYNFSALVYSQYYSKIKDRESKDIKKIIELQDLYKNEDGSSLNFEVYEKNGIIYINLEGTRFQRKVISEIGFDNISPAEQMNLQILSYNYNGSKFNGEIDLCEQYPDLHDGDCIKYKEMSPLSFIGFHASLIPFSDQSPSPRMIYQCGMQKQAIQQIYPSVSHNVHDLSNNAIKISNTPKSIGLFYTQKPIISTSVFDEHNLELYGLGVNISIAILSYTSYDMEDALILNKRSVEYGLFDGMVFKNIVEEGPDIFCPLNIGDVITRNTVIFIKKHGEEVEIIRYKNSDEVILHSVRVWENKCLITTKERRGVSVGDKFSSRHGQKGVCSAVFDERDLPFFEGGGVDLIINPHAFPSRMTIGMLVECLASVGNCEDIEKYNEKVRLLNKGLNTDSDGYRYRDASTPFCFYYNNMRKNLKDLNMETEITKQDAIKLFSSLIPESSIYSNDATVQMYSGQLGTPLKDFTFAGFSFYQRLRHMVSDKYQVRALGPVDNIMGQPVKGRSRHGGIRFGEMERDCLIAHGVSNILKERLLHSSDGISVVVCECGLLNGCSFKKDSSSSDSSCNSLYGGYTECERREVIIPSAFRYLVVELAGMGVKVLLK